MKLDLSLTEHGVFAVADAAADAAVHRRAWVTAAAASWLSYLPLPALSQARAKPALIAILVVGSPDSAAPALDTFKRGLRQLGWMESQNLAFEARYAHGHTERLPLLARELVALNPDVIWAAITEAALAAMKETSTIPIVFAAAGDPVGVGLVQSLARPAGNVTGVSNFQIDYIRKLLEFLRTARPGLARVALLADPVGVRIYQRQLEEGARSLNLQLISAEVRAAEDLAEAFALMHRERADAVIVVGGGLQTLLADRIDELLLNYRLPAAYSNRYSLRRNGLIAYSQNPDESWRLSAGYVDRILKGAKPAEMPVVQPTRVELVINLRAAKALGLTIPQSLLLRADEVIE